ADVLTVAHEHVNVPVLKCAPVVRAYADPLMGDDRHGAVGDGIDGCAWRTGDVDALVEREAAASVHERVERRAPVELHARVAQVRANEVLAVEGLDRVAVAFARDGRGLGPGRP